MSESYTAHSERDRFHQPNIRLENANHPDQGGSQNADPVVSPIAVVSLVYGYEGVSLQATLPAGIESLPNSQECESIQRPSSNAMLQASKTRIAELEAKLENYGLHILALQTQHNQMLKSTSWRITRPIRFVAKLVQFLRRTHWLRVLICLPGAMRGESRKFGISGLLRRLPRYLRHLPSYIQMLGSEIQNSPLSFLSTEAVGNKAPPDRIHPELWSSRIPIDTTVSVVIPTLNAGEEFAFLLQKLRGQLGVSGVEIIVIDSGSTDSTVHWAKHYGCKVLEIPKAEFSHSGTRNRGADAATGDYILFMVQDAYPIGDYWLFGMLEYLQSKKSSGLAAVSCSEFSRSDSDMMYDSMINTHYKFLGCLTNDRIGKFEGDSHAALRTQGQLSDVSCLMSREVFQKYRYRGEYAEDLDLGIRLIRDSHSVAMLASVKVIHSHNRPPFYYLRRSLVDVIFLVNVFPDFDVRPCRSLPGLIAGMVSCAQEVDLWLRQIELCTEDSALSALVQQWIDAHRNNPSHHVRDSRVDLSDVKLDEFVNVKLVDYLSKIIDVPNSAFIEESSIFRDSFVARLDHFNQFAAGVYGKHDSGLRVELKSAIQKIFSSACGAALAFFYLKQDFGTKDESNWISNVCEELRVGI